MLWNDLECIVFSLYVLFTINLFTLTNILVCRRVFSSARLLHSIIQTYGRGIHIHNIVTLEGLQ